MSKKKPKTVDVLAKARACIVNGRYLDTMHAKQREIERRITLQDALYVIKHGYHEKRKDQYSEEWQSWNYALRGNDLGNRDIRVIAGFDEEDMLIITVMEVG